MMHHIFPIPDFLRNAVTAASLDSFFCGESYPGEDRFCFILLNAFEDLPGSSHGRYKNMYKKALSSRSIFGKNRHRYIIG